MKICLLLFSKLLQLSLLFLSQSCLLLCTNLNKSSCRSPFAAFLLLPHPELLIIKLPTLTHQRWLGPLVLFSMPIRSQCPQNQLQSSVSLPFLFFSANTYLSLPCPSVQSLFLNSLELLQCAQNASHILQSLLFCPVYASLHPEDKNFALVISLAKGSCIELIHANCPSSCPFNPGHCLSGLALGCLWTKCLCPTLKSKIHVLKYLQVIVFGDGACRR